MPDQLRLYLKGHRRYQPNFVVETAATKLLCETKRRDQLVTPEVQAKRHAAETWCRYATTHGLAHGGKHWCYLLVPHDEIHTNYTLAGLL